MVLPFPRFKPKLCLMFILFFFQFSVRVFTNLYIMFAVTSNFQTHVFYFLFFLYFLQKGVVFYYFFLITLCAVFFLFPDPSPDWIVGVSGLELCRRNCSWVEYKVLNLYPWDAGTDSGITYTVSVFALLRFLSHFPFFVFFLYLNGFSNKFVQC